MRLRDCLPRYSTTYWIPCHGPEKQLRKNFQLGEFQSKDGTLAVALHPALLDGLQAMRDELGPMRVTSGFRTAAHNERVGGAAESLHMKGMAADIVATEATVIKTERLAEELGFGGIGKYLNFTHVDVGSEDRRWGPRSGD